MEYEDLEKEMCNFDKYIKQTMDLLKDAYKWKMLAKHCDEPEMKAKYMQVSDTLFNLFMVEHENVGNMFKSE